MVATDHFLLTVPVGSIIIGSNVTETILREIPTDALQMWENGTNVLCLKKGGVELFKEYSKERIQELIGVRTPIGYKAELELLKSLLKNYNKLNPLEKKQPVK